MTDTIFDHDRLDVYRCELKLKLKRIVSMLTRMAMNFDGVAESQAAYHAKVDYEHEHHCVEHEYDDKKPTQRVADEP